MNTEKILALINSEEINDWINTFKQKVENEAIKNSEYIQIHNKNYHLNNSDFAFVEELEIINILEKKDKKISKKEFSKNKIVKNYQKAAEKLNQKLMQKYESAIQRKNIKIKTLNLIKAENKEKIKSLELKICELLAAEWTNQLQLFGLS